MLFCYYVEEVKKVKKKKRERMMLGPCIIRDETEFLDSAEWVLTQCHSSGVVPVFFI